MNPDFLVSGVLQAMLGGRRKRSRRAARYLTRGGGRLVSTALSHPGALLAAAGVAWGVMETLQQTGQASAPAQAVPPLPGSPPPVPAPADSVPEDALRMIRLAVSAAHADGAISDQERAAVLQQAREAGVAEVLERELEAPRPLAEIVAGVSGEAERAALYVLAFTILRADEQLTGAERIYLAQLANRLAIDPAMAQRLERDAGERIDALGDQGQPGG